MLQILPLKGCTLKKNCANLPGYLSQSIWISHVHASMNYRADGFNNNWYYQAFLWNSYHYYLHFGYVEIKTQKSSDPVLGCTVSKWLGWLSQPGSLVPKNATFGKFSKEWRLLGNTEGLWRTCSKEKTQKQVPPFWKIVA